MRASRYRHRSTSEPVQCKIEDAQLQIYVPKQHMVPILHQRLVRGLTCAVYVATAETGILYIAVIKCPTADQTNCYETIQSLAAPLVAWAYEEYAFIPPFVSTSLRSTITTQLEFWHIVDGHVKVNGAFLPLKLFKHAVQSF